MSLVERIRNDLKTALKSNNKSRIHPLRMILSEIEYALSTHKQKHCDVLDVLVAYQKRLEASLESFPQGGRRIEMAEEVKLLRAYTEDKQGLLELDEAIDRLLSQKKSKNGDFPNLYSSLIETFGEKFDHKLIGSKLKEQLSYDARKS